MRRKVYISIPITGRELEVAKEHANRLKRIFEDNHYTAITPFDVCSVPDRPYSYYMGRDIETLLECDLICMGKDWDISKGCNCEYQTALIYGKGVLFEETLWQNLKGGEFIPTF